jgi:hypothetical protein
MIPKGNLELQGKRKSNRTDKYLEKDIYPFSLIKFLKLCMTIERKIDHIV